MSAPTITIRFTGDLKDLEAKTKAAADTVNRTGDKIGAPSARQRTAFSSLQDRFKQLVGIGKQHGQETGDAFSKEVESKGGGGFMKLGGLAKGALLGLGAKMGLDLAAEFSSALSGASDLQQSVGGLQAVFKGSAFTTMDTQAQGAAKSLGLSRNAFNELATTLGAGLKNKGIKDYAGETQKLIGLGSDLAAQYGGSTQEAVEAISSLMRGETDPIERYGVAINETAVNAELAAKGQTKLKGSALEQAKAQARVNVLMRQTADAHGAFSRESDTAAGKQQRAAAMWEDVKTRLGSAVLPVMTKFFGFFSDTALPAINDFTSKAGPALKGLWDLFIGGNYTDALASAFGIEKDHPLVGWVLTARDTVKGVYDEIVEGARGFVDSWLGVDKAVTSAGFPGWMEDMASRLRTGFEGIQAAFRRTWEIVQPIAMQVYDWLITKWGEIQPKVSEMFAALSETVTSGMEYVQAIIARVTDVVSWIWSTWGENILTTIGIVIDLIVGVFTGLFQTVGGIWKMMTGLLTGDFGKAKEGLIQIGNGLWTSIVAVFTGIRDQGLNAFDALLNGIDRIWGGVGNVVGKPINIVIGFINDGIIGAYNWVAVKLGMPEMSDIPKLKLTSSGRGSTGGRGTATALAGGGLVDLPWDPARRDPYTGVTPRGQFHFEGEEFFIRRQATKQLERNHPGALDYINKWGQLPGYAGGGTVRPVNVSSSGWNGGRYRSGGWHGGLDFPALIGTPVRAMWDGRISKLAKLTTSYGQHVKIDHGGGMQTLYAHMSAILTSLGAAVKAGQQIGRVGSTGNSTGPHLHLEVRRGGAQVDPSPYLSGASRAALGAVPDGASISGEAPSVSRELSAAISAGFDSIAGWISGIRDRISSAIPSFGGGMIGDLADGLANRLRSGTVEWAKSKLGYRAGTRSAGSGLYWAGESQPELIDFRGGERVSTLSQLRSSDPAPSATDVEALVERLVEQLTDALAEREPTVLVLQEGDIRRVVRSEMKRGL